MTKFERRPQIIEAEQFIRDQQPWPAGTCLCSNAGYWGLHVHGEHEVHPLSNGFWVVRHENGFYEALADEEFRTLYRPL